MNDGEEQDPQLRKVLRSWSVDDPLPNNFRSGVWSRIEQRQQKLAITGWQSRLVKMQEIFCRPAVAVSYVVILLVSGLMLGHQRAQAFSEITASTLQKRYVQAVDPYQTPRNN